jgi:hypothetical protein
MLETPLLDSLWSECLSTRKKISYNYDSLAAPFWSAADARLGEFEKRFMMVGRATRGPFEPGAFTAALEKSPASALEERKRFNRTLVHRHSKSSGFWRAFVYGSKLCGSADPFENAVWTNLTKIGLANKDVDTALFSLQEDLSTRILKAELEAYNPTLVHLAVNTLGSECIFKATGTKDADWERLALDGPNDDIWFLDFGRRKMIWTRHPNRAPPTLVSAWNTKLRELSESS